MSTAADEAVDEIRPVFVQTKLGPEIKKFLEWLETEQNNLNRGE